MQIRALKLHNIRSYTQAQIEFPQGPVLLSGDIGSGKSTILLAVEFGLFGAKSGELPASTLLRHGANDGSVELHIDIEGIETVIVRNLKRAAHGIKQEAGYIIKNGVKKDCSPVELRAEVFGMLGYPPELISKNKDLLFRSTVYTPQEDMKKIIVQDADSRLDTLRKVFNIDKYKRIRENATTIVRSCKEQKRLHQGMAMDLEQKKVQEDAHNKLLIELHDKITAQEPQYQEAAKTVLAKKENIQLYEQSIKQLQEKNNMLARVDVELKNVVSQHQLAHHELQVLKAEIEDLSKAVADKEIVGKAELEVTLDQKKRTIVDLEQSLAKIEETIAASLLNVQNAEEVIKKIHTLDNCPVCLQTVGTDHKVAIGSREHATIAQSQTQLAHAVEQQNAEKSKKEQLVAEKEALQKKVHEQDLVALQRKNLIQKQSTATEIEAAQDARKKSIGQFNAQKMELSKVIESLKSVEQAYQKAKHDLDHAVQQEKQLAVAKAQVEQQMKTVEVQLTEIAKEIEAKKQAQKKATEIGQHQDYMSEFFVQLMSTMEKHRMLSVQQQFNDLFSEWFNILIEDEAIGVRIDDQFTPIVDQNGYETAIENLSGGEKTAVALAYRLALNKVINDVVSDIKTKNIIVLDEPTDGFSNEQLDRIRDVLELLDMKQILIVSHEQKIESYVDHIIRVEKQDHVSAVLQ